MRLSPSVVLLRTQSDDRLTALAREGSEPAFTALVERYRRTVLRACCRVLSEARAEDATQQTFIAAWNALNRGDDVREVRPWLLRIACNTSLNALRNPGYEYVELAESLQSGSAPQAELERREVMRQTLAGLAALPENQRQALLRSAVGGAPHADIARELGISEGATRQLVMRARATMRSGVTALTPLPLLNWAAAGGGAVGSAFAAKAAAVVIVGGSAVATPIVVTRGVDEPAAARTAEREQRLSPERRRVPRPGATATATVAAVAKVRDTARRKPDPERETVERRPAQEADEPGEDRRRGRERGGSADDESGDSDRSDSTGRDREDDNSDDDPGDSGSGTSGSGNSGSGESGSGHSGSGSSGSGSDDDPEDDDVGAVAAPVPNVVATATPDGDDGGRSGSGSGSDDEEG